MFRAKHGAIMLGVFIIIVAIVILLYAVNDTTNFLVSPLAEPTICTRRHSLSVWVDSPRTLKVSVPREMKDDESLGKEYVSSFDSPISTPCF